MKDLEQARNFLSIASKDYRALCGMEDPEVFSSEIFGFHVQQAAEKALKAWLCILGVPFPKTHDLDELGALLEEAGQKIPKFLQTLLEFTDFAVAFRYDAFPDLEGDIDRDVCIDQVGRLLQYVQQILAESKT
jgi:HEPN domain-containing protein